MNGAYISSLLEDAMLMPKRMRVDRKVWRCFALNPITSSSPSLWRDSSGGRKTFVLGPLPRRSETAAADALVSVPPAGGNSPRLRLSFSLWCVCVWRWMGRGQSGAAVHVPEGFHTCDMDPSKCIIQTMHA